MQLEFKKQSVKLVNVNIRAENAGEDKVLAADLSVTAKLSNDVLTQFDPSLKSAFFKEPDAGQTDLPLEEQGRLSAPRFPDMSAVGWGVELEDYTFLLHHGVGGKSDLKLIDCKVNHLRFAAIEGGAIELSMRIQVYPKPEDLPTLAKHLQKDVDIDLTPPEQPVIE